MKWNEIYDRSKVIVRRAVERLEEEETSVSPEGNDDMESIVEHLQDSDFLSTELKRRERYDYREAYHKLRQQERRRKHLRLAAVFSGAACVVAACCLLVIQWNMYEEPVVPVAQMVPSRGVKAILVKEDGERLLLNEESRQLSGGAGVRVAVDSTGIQYEVQDSLGDDSLVYNTLVVPRGGVYQLTLSDGTRVWLNSDSRLVYPVAFSGETREVKLNGEAYFEVKKDTGKPFIVETYLGKVKVLGTQFNVKYYPEEAFVATTLVSGKVSFGNTLVKDTELEPGYQAVFKEGADKVEVKKVNVQHFTGWKDNQISFQGESLESIMQMLVRWYDVNVVFEDESLKQLEFSGNLDKYENIDTFFKLFELGANVRFEIRGNVILVKKK